MEPMPALYFSNHSDRNARPLALVCGLMLAGLLPCARGARVSGASLLIDQSQSRVEIVVKATIGSFTARLHTFKAAITVAPDGVRVESARFYADWAAVKTGVERRDTDLNEWMQTAKFPTVEFVMTDYAPAGPGAYTVRGRLRLHGIERTISFPISIIAGMGLWVADGKVTIDTRDYGLPIITKFLLLKVDPLVQVRFHLQGSIPAT